MAACRDLQARHASRSLLVWFWLVVLAALIMALA